MKLGHEKLFISFNVPTHDQVEKLIEVLEEIKDILKKFYKAYHTVHRPATVKITAIVSNKEDSNV